MPVFELSWSNDCVFTLLVIALLFPLTKIPLLFFDTKKEFARMAFLGAMENASARALQIQILSASLERFNTE